MARRRRPLRITSFADAAGTAFGLRDRFTHAHAVAVLDRHGRVLDLTLFTGADHSVDTALGWADCFVLNDERAERVVLLSAVESRVADGLRECDLDTLRSARKVFGELGVLVVDWLQCDGDDVLSLDLAGDDEGWRRLAPVP